MFMFSVTDWLIKNYLSHSFHNQFPHLKTSGGPLISQLSHKYWNHKLLTYCLLTEYLTSLFSKLTTKGLFIIWFMLNMCIL